MAGQVSAKPRRRSLNGRFGNLEVVRVWITGRRVHTCWRIKCSILAATDRAGSSAGRGLRNERGLANCPEQAAFEGSKTNTHPSKAFLIGNNFIGPAGSKRRCVPQRLGRKGLAAPVKDRHFKRAAMENSERSGGAKSAVLQLQFERLGDQRAGIDGRNRRRAQGSALPCYREGEVFARQFDERKVEPNSGLGTAITYLLRHWHRLTLFLRQAGAPLDSNFVERALKKAILHRKNSLFYKTEKGAEVGELFMSLIHTCELNGANPFDYLYLTELQKHAAELAENPAAWMPSNSPQTLPQATTSQDPA
jgi:transposase IS66 family protein